MFKPLGDCSLLAYLAHEATAVRFAKAIDQAKFPWLLDVVPAYASVGIFFDPALVQLQQVREVLTMLRVGSDEATRGTTHLIPCCYELGLDLERVAAAKGLTTQRVIELHSGHEYAVYAIGFTPGYPYLGYLPPELEGMPRLPSPRQRVEPGSVGLAARQTGVYTLPRPGGWNLIGRTPLEMVNVDEGYFPLRVGDQVRFAVIGREEFESRRGERLLPP